MITVTAMKWAPPFAAGQVRDHRVRWILNEVGWPYEVRLVDAPTMKSARYLGAQQPFGQLPVLEEEGRPPLFESGAIVLDVAMRAGRYIGADGTPERSAAIQWVVAGLNSVEPFLFNVAEVEYFMDDPAAQAARRPAVTAMAKERLALLEKARDGRAWFVGDAFSVADLMVASILKIAHRLELLNDLPALAAWQQAILARPAHVKAEQDQMAEIARHSSADMRYDAVPKPPAR
ncbi:glutathione S-transferase family protein [Pseudorhodoferax sp. Leaf267]|uniref:glutathione S-transferase family protein n=1 Tax=Pseudorhodoferax sp. Leaf267 TaxID=1736316 RepID=UPI0006F3382B|nr:glutathione S-transferase family protein [Pseudorhodoferax sp. Leaf267]KQP22844.1 glutathione S-transferase [Pseudorhodoferax sp. Leaf267]